MTNYKIKKYIIIDIYKSIQLNSIIVYKSTYK